MNTWKFGQGRLEEKLRPLFLLHIFLQNRSNVIPYPPQIVLWYSNLMEQAPNTVIESKEKPNVNYTAFLLEIFLN